MKWTTETPRANGWYFLWTKASFVTGEQKEVVLVVKHPFFHRYYYGKDIKHLTNEVPLSMNKNQLWAGPIDEPEGIQNEVDN